MLISLALAGINSVKASPFSIADAGSSGVGDDGEEFGSPAFWYKLILSAVLVLVGGVFAGLTLGLMGLDELHLRVLSSSSEDPVERRNAVKVLQLLSRGRHWVLVVLLLGNVIVNESLPIFLDDALGGGVAAIAISTTMIVIFGIIPQAVSVRYGLAIGAKCAPVVLGMMYLFAPIAWPIAKLLDHVLGKDEAHTYKKAELKTFLQFHRQGEEPLRDDEISILNGVLELNTKDVATIMTPMKDVVTLSYDKVLDHDTVDYILRSGYSRIPVHEPYKPKSFIGLLLIKRLLSYDPARCWPVSKFSLSILPEADPSINCFQALDYFQTGRAHLLLLSKTPGIAGGAIGVVTLEDIIEEIISEEIVDETDRYEDNQSKRRARRVKNAAVMRGIVEYRTSRHNSLQTLNERTPLLALPRALSPSRESDTESLVANGQADGSAVAPGNPPPQAVVVQPATPPQAFAGLAAYGSTAVGVESPLRREHTPPVHDEPEEFQVHEQPKAGEGDAGRQ
ncbi:hypothetical protein EIP91_010090 [Steccherinum ochraceum]|uniref:CNNM transmembrane domain-containing protein n=1 Tax=Steccherinum ochraceum TaxID=92696 RepID=A0A4R0S3N9_9APHY|nr:hypothetical protein EIP91_010090 [Steccherinum ochraceum]